MTPEERQMLVDLFERIRANANGPRDAQAEALINDAVRAIPFAPYVLAQTVLVQQQALEGATRRISELEARQAPQEETSFLGNLGRSLFGGASAPPPQSPPPRGYDASAYRGAAPQQPTYAPQPQAYAPQPGPWGAAAAPAAAGGGFLSGALHTAAGVAGGVVLANALGGLIGGHGGGLFGGSGGRETVNNFYETDPAAQHAQDVLQDQDQDQDDAQDAGDSSYDAAGYDDGGSTDT